MYVDFLVSLFWQRQIIFQQQTILFMIYGYIRVSTDTQTVENQRFEITQFLQKKDMVVDGWIEETISGTKSYNKRQLGVLLKRVQKDDLIICAELSRLGPFQINDARQIPIVIPTTNQLVQFTNIFNRALLIKQTTNSESDLQQIQIELEELVLALYDIKKG